MDLTATGEPVIVHRGVPRLGAVRSCPREAVGSAGGQVLGQGPDGKPVGLTVGLFNDTCHDARLGIPPRSGRSWPSPRPPPQTSASPTCRLAAPDVGMSSACSLNALPTRGDPREHAWRDAAHPHSQPPSTESSETAHRHVGEAANASTRDEPLAALAAAEDITGAARGRWVNAGLVQDEYHDCVVAGRPANSSPDGNPRPCLRPDFDDQAAGSRNCGQWRFQRTPSAGQAPRDAYRPGALPRQPC